MVTNAADESVVGKYFLSAALIQTGLCHFGACCKLNDSSENSGKE